jgi:hypothetical protein
MILNIFFNNELVTMTDETNSYAELCLQKQATYSGYSGGGGGGGE